MKTEEEIEDMLRRLEDEGEDYYFGMSYYEGVKVTLEWVAGSSEEPVES